MVHMTSWCIWSAYGYKHPTRLVSARPRASLGQSPPHMADCEEHRRRTFSERRGPVHQGGYQALAGRDRQRDITDLVTGRESLDTQLESLRHLSHLGPAAPTKKIGTLSYLSGNKHHKPC